MILIRVYASRLAGSVVLISILTTTCISFASPKNQEPCPVTLAQKLCDNYSQIKTLSCQIRKTTKGGEQTVRLLSRVHYKFPNQIHVENVSPIKRTIIADGKILYYYQERSLRGFSQPIDELSDLWLASLHNIPGTALEHLIPLHGIEETKLSNTENGLIQRGYQAKNTFVVLIVDSKTQLQQINFFKDPEMQTKTGQYIYSKQQEVSPNCWLPTLHKAILYLPTGNKITETSHITNISVNEEIPEHLFNHDLFMKNIKFTSEYKNTYQ